MSPTASDADHIDVNDPQVCAHWAGRLDATEEELREAVAAVGDNPGNVELHLKGVRSSTNSDRVKEELGRG
ncbi:MAG: hypothetical protein NVS2B4_07550 [Ramlibacter sp.]